MQFTYIASRVTQTVHHVPCEYCSKLPSTDLQVDVLRRAVVVIVPDVLDVGYLQYGGLEHRIAQSQTCWGTMLTRGGSKKRQYCGQAGCRERGGGCNRHRSSGLPHELSFTHLPWVPCTSVHEAHLTHVEVAGQVAPCSHTVRVNRLPTVVTGGHVRATGIPAQQKHSHTTVLYWSNV